MTPDDERTEREQRTRKLAVHAMAALVLVWTALLVLLTLTALVRCAS